MKCKPYSEIIVEMGTQLKTVNICSVETHLLFQIQEFILQQLEI